MVLTILFQLNRLIKMTERIFTGWTFQRVLYFLLGAIVMVQGIVDGQWIGVLFGGYFASMGLFAFGCAAGNCYTGNNTINNEQKSTSAIQDVEYEEIKIK